MALIHDVMPAFELFQPATVNDTLALLDKHKKAAWVLAGGLDTFDWLKDRNKRPEVVVDISGVEELKGVKTAPDGAIEIGAATILSDVVRHPLVREKYPILMQAAELVASPQIRNQGTIGGNVSQDTRCWYYRSGWSCYRAGGNICYADTPTAINREHAIFDANRCVAVNPSDTAPALIALDAKMVIRSSKGERVVDAENFFIGPAIDITRMTVLEPGELLNVAAVFVVSGGKIDRSRIAVNAVAARPMRLTSVEAAIAGKPRSEETAKMAGELAVQGAQPLAHNGYKIPLMRNLVKRAIRGETV